MLSNILKSSLILSLGILLGRFSGFIRELLVSRKYGTSIHADEIILALTVPDLLNNLIASGAVSGLLLPLIASHYYQRYYVLKAFTKKLGVVTVFLFFIISSLIFINYKFHTYLILVVALVSIFPNIITFICSSYLQYENRFKAQSLNTFIFNMVIIVAILCNIIGVLFGACIIIASIVRAGWMFFDLHKSNLFSALIKNKPKQSSYKSQLTYKTFCTIMIANGLIYVFPVIDKLTAAKLQTGSVSVLSYAEKIYLLPISVFLTTFSVALLPELSKLVANQNFKELNVLIKKSLPLNFLLSVIIGVLLYVFSSQISNIIFGLGGGLKLDQVNEVGNILKNYVPIVFFAGSVSILLNVLFALKAYEYLIFYSLFLLVLKIVMNFIVVIYTLPIKYIALFSSILSFIGFVFLLIAVPLILKNKAKTS